MASAHVVDSGGKFSEQIDVVVYDRQYSPLIFEIEGEKVIPAESVYAAFEAKQTMNADLEPFCLNRSRWFALNGLFTEKFVEPDFPDHPEKD